MSEQSAHNMSISRCFDAPIERVWEAWSEADQVMRWWGPVGFTSPRCKMDFREGGTTLVCMKAPASFGGQEMYNTWTYTKIIPMKDIEFVQRFCDPEGNAIAPTALGLPAGIPFEVRHLLTFTPQGTQTEFTVTEFGYTDAQTVEMSRLGMEQCLDKLAASIS